MSFTNIDLQEMKKWLPKGRSPSNHAIQDLITRLEAAEAVCNDILHDQESPLLQAWLKSKGEEPND